MTRSILFTLCATISLALFSSNATAAHIDGNGDPTGIGHTVPTGLNVGDQYRLIFESSGDLGLQIAGTSGDINVYNAYVQSVAATQPALVALGVDWKAIASTSTVDARDNTDTCPTCTDVPLFMLNDTQFATGNAFLWSAADNTTNYLPFALKVKENGLVQGNGQRNWTGTAFDGTASANPLGPFTQLTDGISSREHGGWVSNGPRNAKNNSGVEIKRRMYAISSVLTVVPEPSSVALLLFGACGLLATRRRGK